uniref:Uncharacterized protein n=1 Tax=Knipowitschia caucasica TaxID=637954 RepID=A0AAV2M6H1_KNICA
MADLGESLCGSSLRFKLPRITKEFSEPVEQEQPGRQRPSLDPRKSRLITPTQEPSTDTSQRILTVLRTTRIKQRKQEQHLLSAAGHVTLSQSTLFTVFTCQLLITAHPLDEALCNQSNWSKLS